MCNVRREGSREWVNTSLHQSSLQRKGSKMSSIILVTPCGLKLRIHSNKQIHWGFTPSIKNIIIQHDHALQGTQTINLQSMICKTFSASKHQTPVYNVVYKTHYFASTFIPCPIVPNERIPLSKYSTSESIRRGVILLQFQSHPKNY